MIDMYQTPFEKALESYCGILFEQSQYFMEFSEQMLDRAGFSALVEECEEAKKLFSLDPAVDIALRRRFANFPKHTMLTYELCQHYEQMSDEDHYELAGLMHVTPADIERRIQQALKEGRMREHVRVWQFVPFVNSSPPIMSRDHELIQIEAKPQISYQMREFDQPKDAHQISVSPNPLQILQDAILSSRGRLSNEMPYDPSQMMYEIKQRLERAVNDNN